MQPTTSIVVRVSGGGLSRVVQAVGDLAADLLWLCGNLLIIALALFVARAAGVHLPPVVERVLDVVSSWWFPVGGRG